MRQLNGVEIQNIFSTKAVLQLTKQNYGRLITPFIKYLMNPSTKDDLEEGLCSFSAQELENWYLTLKELSFTWDMGCRDIYIESNQLTGLLEVQKLLSNLDIQYIYRKQS